MIFRDITILTEEMAIREHVNVRVEEDRIAEISDYTESAFKETDDEIIEGKNLILIPGFYNSHAHSPMALMRGYGENLTLKSWLLDRIFPFEDKLTNKAVYYGTLLCMAESLKYGIVSTSDMYYFLDDMIEAYSEAGVKGNISRAIANPSGMGFDKLPAVSEMLDAIKKYHGAFGGKIKIDASLHAEYTSDEDTVKGLASLNKDLGLVMHVHASETLSEHEECKARHDGRTPIKYFSDCGLFDGKSLAAHCVWVEDNDIDIMREKGVTVATNPVSNLKLASGICDVKKLIDNDVNVSIGTDSVASNNNLSIFEEMKTAFLIAKIKNNDSRGITPEEVIAMATRMGALAQGRDDCGLIKEGYKADIVAVKTDSPNMVPVYNMATNLVLSATDSDIYMTVVDGKVLYKNGEYMSIDIERVIFGVKEAVNDIISRL